MALKISIEIEAPNEDEAQNMLERIGIKIAEGDMEGDGFSVEGSSDEEKDE